LRFNRHSINQYYRYARDICSWEIVNDKENFQFGGEGKIVQIDESVISKRKYNRGKKVVTRWILGIYDTNKKSGIVVYVPKRDANTLLPLIERYVEKRTEIWTDQWKAHSQ